MRMSKMLERRAGDSTTASAGASPQPPVKGKKLSLTASCCPRWPWRHGGHRSSTNTRTSCQCGPGVPAILEEIAQSTLRLPGQSAQIQNDLIQNPYPARFAHPAGSPQGHRRRHTPTADLGSTERTALLNSRSSDGKSVRSGLCHARSGLCHGWVASRRPNVR